ncbi:MAG: hypothetical protein LBD11_07795 [Candidatus Peribacteria bacterium]|nr:hypothetical protein [Candidatus Peribacteria bacterium]
MLLDGDITEPLDPDMITDIQDRFLQNPQLQMVIIGVNEEYATDTVMIEASGQRVLKF